MLYILDQIFGSVAFSSVRKKMLLHKNFYYLFLKQSKRIQKNVKRITKNEITNFLSLNDLIISEMFFKECNCS